MNNTELKMILKLIDLHTEEYQPNYYNAPKEKQIKNIEALKQDIKDLFEQRSDNNGK